MIKVFSDSQLVVNQVIDEYTAREPNLMKYLDMVISLHKQFKKFYVTNLLRDDNRCIDPYEPP